MEISTINRVMRDPVVDDLTRREFVTGLLAACGGGASEAPADESSRRIDNEFGSTDVPADPGRIAAGLILDEIEKALLG